MDHDESAGNVNEELNPYQKRCLEITLRMLEEALDYVELMQKVAPIRGVYYELENPYTSDEMEALRRTSEKIRRVLRDCRERWALRSESRSLDALIRSKMSVLWADLEDCLPPKLRRYGDVPVDLQDDIDDVIRWLIRSVEDFGSHR